MASITSASSEQKAGIRTVNAAILQLDNPAQQMPRLQRRGYAAARRAPYFLDLSPKSHLDSRAIFAKLPGAANRSENQGLECRRQAHRKQNA
jgi:hypothetical protein